MGLLRQKIITYDGALRQATNRDDSALRAPEISATTASGTISRARPELPRHPHRRRHRRAPQRRAPPRSAGLPPPRGQALPAPRPAPAAAAPAGSPSSPGAADLAWLERRRLSDRALLAPTAAMTSFQALVRLLSARERTGPRTCAPVWRERAFLPRCHRRLASNGPLRSVTLTTCAPPAPRRPRSWPRECRVRSPSKAARERGPESGHDRSDGRGPRRSVPGPDRAGTAISIPASSAERVARFLAGRGFDADLIEDLVRKPAD